MTDYFHLNAAPDTVRAISSLGLALAHDFIWQHQGSIEVESVPGRTCFTVCLPLLNATPEEKQ